eukprot:g7287.t1
MFASDEIGLLRMLSMRRLTGLLWALDQNESSSAFQELFVPPGPERAAQLEAMLLGPSGGGGSRGLGNNVSAGTCPERVLLEVVARRCELHRREAQRLSWSDSLQAISEAVALDLETWATRHRLDLSDSGGSSRRLGALKWRAAQTLASIQELDQVIATLRVVPLHRLITGDQELMAADLPGKALPPFWSALPFVVRCALLRMSTVCGIGSLLYVLNIHRLAICVARRQIPTSVSEVGRNGYQGAETRALFQGEWQLQRLENFGEEYYPEKNPKLFQLRRHMCGFRIFGDIMEDLWGGEPTEIFFVHLRKLERRLLHMDRIARLLATAEDATSGRAFLHPCSAVEFDEVASCGGASWAASELLSERDEVCSSTTSALRNAAEMSGRADEAPPSRASSPSIEQVDLEMQIRDGGGWLATRDDHLHDQRRKLKKEVVEPLAAFPGSEGTNFLRGLKTTKASYMMHLEKRPANGLDGATCLGSYIE